MILTHMLAPPCCIRPSVTTGFTSNEDDLTIKLKEIISADQSLRSEACKGTALSGMDDILFS
jgi:DNA-directed RNA polymerase beta' subunit